MGIDVAAAQAVILGATGSIGRISARLLLPQVGRLTLFGRRREALEEVAEQLDEPHRVGVETDLSAALRDADIIIAVTSSLEAIVEPEHLKPGAVVCDIARPRDVSRRVVEQRDDVLVVEGGAVAIPGHVTFGLDFGFPPGMAYACMAETMILALEGRTGDYSLGRELKLEQVEEISALARKHGFKIAGLRSFEKQLTDEQIERVAQRARQRVRAVGQ
jgi:predicted amino acid dehydrogenase